MDSKLPNVLSTVKNHLERIKPHRWTANIKDPRAKINRKWNLSYVLEVITAGMLSGTKTLRSLETLSELLGNRISDTTLHGILVKLASEPLHKALEEDVKCALRSHELAKDDFPVRITAIDGKSISMTERKVNDYSDPVSGSGAGQFRHMVLRALHVSSETKLFLGQRAIPSKGAETKELRPFIETLLSAYGKTELLEVLSVDAGMVSKENSDFIREKGLHYIMALKGCQATLFAYANDVLSDSSEPVLKTTEIVNGKSVLRELRRYSIVGSLHNWEHIKEIWRIQQTVTDKKTKKETLENRFFLTSLPPEMLSDTHVLQAIRMHWGIENNGFWNLDTAWSEDSSPWVNSAMLFISLMRMLSYNTIARLRTRKWRSARARQVSWASIMKLMEHACCHLRFEAVASNTATPANC